MTMRKLLVTGGLGLVCALTACATDPTDNYQEPIVSPGAKYVAMGSSFAAGAGIGPHKANSPARCSRTVNNYASLVADRLQLALDDQSCGGATTAHILSSWDELPPQIDAIDADTRLVTLTIGGNDINYVGNLFMASCAAGRVLELGGRTIPCRPPSEPTEDSYANLEQSLIDVAAQVEMRAPDAVLVFVQYLSLVPASNCEASEMSVEDAALAREIGRRLAEITARVAVETGSLLLASDELSREHTPCDAIPWATGFPPDHDPSIGAPWHPNAAGHAAIAEALADMLKQGPKAAS